MVLPRHDREALDLVGDGAGFGGQRPTHFPADHETEQLENLGLDPSPGEARAGGTHDAPLPRVEPFCTSAPQDESESDECALEEPVAPPQPSRPVLPPSRITMSPAAGVSRRTFARGAAPTTAPISIRFAKNPS